jgi:hypothetical protein
MDEPRKRASKLLGRMIAEVENTAPGEAPDCLGAWLHACAETVHATKNPSGVPCGLVHSEGVQTPLRFVQDRAAVFSCDNLFQNKRIN